MWIVRKDGQALEKRPGGNARRGTAVLGCTETKALKRFSPVHSARREDNVSTP